MTKLRTSQTGAGVIVVVLALLVVGALGVVGYRVLHTTDVPTSTASSVAVPSVAAPTAINNKTDLKSADTALVNTPIDRGVATDQLDTDIKSLY